MSWQPGQDVEVKTGTGLGMWVRAKVLEVDGCCGRRVYTVVTDGAGRRLEGVQERHVRRVRRSPAQVPAEAPPRRRRPQAAPSERGPMRFPEYRRWIKTKPCIFCWAKADDPHHYGPKGMGQTTDDTRVTPVCRKCHDALHDRRLKDLPAAYHAYNDGHHNWHVVEAHIFRRQVDYLTEFVRVHGGIR